MPWLLAVLSVSFVVGVYSACSTTFPGIAASPGTCAVASDCNGGVAKPSFFANFNGPTMRIGTNPAERGGVIFDDAVNPPTEFINTGGSSANFGIGLGADTVSGSLTCEACYCTETPDAACPASVAAGVACAGGYVISTIGGGGHCIQFRFTLEPERNTFPFPAITGSDLQITIDGDTVTFTNGIYATKAGSLIALALTKGSSEGVLFFGCGPLVKKLSTRKRQAVVQSITNGAGVFQSASVGDPHLTGANGVKFDFDGVANGVYALFSSPVFSVNMQLAPIGPGTRFMIGIGIVYRGESVKLDPWAVVTRRAALTRQFESFGANVTFSGKWSMSIAFCTNHVVTLTSMHSDAQYNGTAINYFDVSFSVPGCHDAYDGALGQTYQCRYVLSRVVFGDWTREREESFRLPALTSPSGNYSPNADCAHEDEFGGDELLGGVKHQSALS